MVFRSREVKWMVSQERREMADSWKDGKGKRGKRKENYVSKRGGNFRRGDRSTNGGQRVEVYK